MLVLLVVVATAAQAADCVIDLCVKNANGMMRIVPDPTYCGNSETAYAMRSAAPSSTPAPLTCPECDLAQTIHLAGKDAREAYLWDASLQEADISGADFTEGVLYSINMQRTNASGTTFTGAWMPSSFFGGTFFHNAILADADLSYSQLPDTEFNGAVATATDFRNCDFNDNNWSDANLTGANFTGATFSGEQYFDNTTCPDGTNSDSHGSTCIGYGM
jgi:uncharacterized protein YjbI with pentapeptide repeats